MTVRAVALAQELNERRLTLVEGSALSERDLVRTRAQSAAAILLLADRFSPSAHQEDLNLQFQVGWAVFLCLGLHRHAWVGLRVVPGALAGLVCMIMHPLSMELNTR